MSTIQLSEREQRPDGSFLVRVVFEDGIEHDVTVHDPADSGVERELAWYFEQHLRYPFLDQDRERAAVEHITAYGESLFAQVFGGDANYAYRRLRSRSFDGCRLEVTGSAALHRLHWEAIRDPELDKPLATRLPVTRRVDGLPFAFDLPAQRPTLNIVVVTARPDGPHDVGYRTISRPLLDTLRQANLPVTIDLVRPGTWEALGEHLQEMTERHGSGWYQIIHFDLHGAFEDFAQLEQQQAAGRVVFGSQLAAFEGRRGFLFFETARDGQARPVAANMVASLLAEHRIPMAVLNACQSAMQTASEAGLAQHLVEAGVPVAVGMAYSVTVSAAERAMPVLYQRLVRGADPVAAIHAVRRELFQHRSRHAYFDQQIELEDWMLPVVFRQRHLQLHPREMTDAEETEFYRRAATVGDEPSTEYGFVGRDLDIQAIERHLLIDAGRNQLLVQGMAGAGKSTLLQHLGWWWQRTGLVDEVFRFSYEDRAWTTDQILREITPRLCGKVEQAKIEALQAPAQLERIAGLLRARRHLLILDNAESITASPAAIPHALDEAERQRLRTLLSRLRGGETLVLLGSREPESWLAAHSFGSNVYPLPGLDPQAASVLVQAILQRHRATHHLENTAERSALEKLRELLGGYPLPLTVVLPVLAGTPPSAVLAELQTGGTGADPVGLISRAIEYSHGKLDPTTQHSLLLLAPFTAVIGTGPILDRYQELLCDQHAVQALGSIDLPAALHQTVSVGLATEDRGAGMVRVQPVLPYFLRTRLADHPDLRAATQRAHYQLYTEYGPEMYRLLISRQSEERATGQFITRAEYPNLTTALDYGLRHERPILPVIFPLEEYLDQTKQQTARRQLLDDAITGCPDNRSESRDQNELSALHNLAGATALDQHRLSDAEAHYQTELRIEQALDNRRSQGGVYHQLGIIARKQRRFDDADTHYRTALDIFLEFNDHHSAARTYHSLGVVAEEQRRFDEAETNYRTALDIFLEFNDHHSAASTYHQLGIIAQTQGRLDEAETNYRTALDIKLEFNDHHSAASTYHQLGMIAEEQQRYDEADTHYRTALGIFLEFNDHHSAASTYHQLGMIAEEQQRYDEADTHYRTALDIKLEFNDHHSAARTYHQLGIIAQTQGRLDEAEIGYRAALDIYRQTSERDASTTATRLRPPEVAEGHSR